MLKNIHNAFIIITIILCLSLSSCTDVSIDLESISGAVGTALSEKSAENQTAEAITLMYDGIFSEPDGSTASMRAFAEALSKYWLDKINELIKNDEVLAEKYSSFEVDLSGELSKEAEKYRSDTSAPYGSAVNYELIIKRAEALEKWYYEHCR